MVARATHHHTEAGNIKFVRPIAGVTLAIHEVLSNEIRRKEGRRAYRHHLSHES